MLPRKGRSVGKKNGKMRQSVHAEEREERTKVRVFELMMCSAKSFASETVESYGF